MAAYEGDVIGLQLLDLFSSCADSTFLCFNYKKVEQVKLRLTTTSRAKNYLVKLGGWGGWGGWGSWGGWGGWGSWGGCGGWGDWVDKVIGVDEVIGVVGAVGVVVAVDGVIGWIR